MARHEVERHRASKSELDDLRALVARDLADATAYNAALLTANLSIACAGARVTARTGHHKISFNSVTLSLGGIARAYTDL